MTPEQCKEYVSDITKISISNIDGIREYDIKLGEWLIETYVDRKTANEQLYRLRQAILETIMVDLVINPNLRQQELKQRKSK